MFVGCDDEDAEGPSIEVRATFPGTNDGRITDGQTIDSQEEGTTISFNVTFLMGDNRLRSARVLSQIGTNPQIVVFDVADADAGLFNRGEEEIKTEFITFVTDELETLTFETVDRRDRAQTHEVKIIAQKVDDPTIAPGRDFAYLIKGESRLGGQGHQTLGSFYNATQGIPYLISAARTNSAVVDFAYFWHATTSATIFSIEQASTDNLVYSSSNTALNPSSAQWATKRSTAFFYVGNVTIAANATPAQISTAVNNFEDGGWWADAEKEIKESGADQKVGNLERGDIVAFRLSHGNPRLEAAFIVTAVVAQPPGSISFRMIEVFER
jgi:hypothetical protein